MNYENSFHYLCEQKAIVALTFEKLSLFFRILSNYFLFIFNLAQTSSS